MMRERLVNIGLVLCLLLVAIGADLSDDSFLITLATRVAILALAGVGLNIALGYGGMVSFGHAAFFGLGGYVTAILTSHARNAEPVMEAPLLIHGTANMLLHWPLAMLLCACIALLIGALSLKTRGVYFIMITLAFAQMLYYFAISWPGYGGEDGLAIYLRSEFPGLDTRKPMNFFLLSFTLLILALWFSSRLSASHFGLALIASRQNAERVASLGVGVYGVQLTAFVLSAMLTGLAGALYVDLNRFASPTMFAWSTSGELIVFVILGGVGRLTGPLVGAALFVSLESVFGGMTEHWKFFVGAVLLFVVLYAPGGLIGALAGPHRHA